MQPVSPTIQTLYQDLVQQVHGAPARAGSVYTRTIKGIDYAYAKVSAGTTRRDVFLGRADDPQVQDKIADIRRGAEQARNRRKIVSALKSAGLPSPAAALGAVLDALADAGLMTEAVLVGTAAYQCFSTVVGHQLPSASLMTLDADLATASLAIGSGGEETLETILHRADSSFAPIPALDHKAPPSSFRSASGIVVDLLTPQLRRDDRNPMPLLKLAAGAVPLQHLRWLIEYPIPAVVLHGSGVPVRVPAPARFAVHKLIIAQKRTADRIKRKKDLLQAEALISALKQSDPWALSDAYENAVNQGFLGWREPAERSLRELGVDPKSLKADNDAG